MGGAKTDEFALEMFQTIFGRLGRSATHDQSCHVRPLLHHDPLGFGKRPIWGESSLLVNEGHRQKLRLDA